jgi:outer membrane receptor protein involved in Fe transport
MRRVNPFIFSTVSLAALAASPAFAQQTTSDQSPPQTLTSEQEIESGQNAQCDNLPAGAQRPASCETITVTGTRIRRPNLESPLPVTSIGGQEFFETGNVAIGDTLNDLPALRSTFGQANSTRFLGTAGLNLLDLRGLGTARTLVLVNGRRHVGGDVLNTGVSPDVNTIPTDLIDRVDVVTGGNSAVYGSDAIAGVVNFVLKSDYDGIQVRGQGGQSKYGDAGSYFISGLVGKNFADGRGNVAVNLEYAKQDDAFASSRWLKSQNGFIQVDADNPDLGPDRLFFRDIRSATLTNTGMVRFGGINTNTGVNPPLNCGFDAFGAGYNCPFMFTPSGDLVPIVGDQRVGLGPNGSFIGGNGENFRSGNQMQLRPRLDRYSANLVAHFDIAPALTPFVEGTFSRTDTSGTGNSGPAFITGTTLGDPAQIPVIFGGLGYNRETPRLDNPFLSAQALGVICAQRTLNGQGCAPATRISVRENMTGLGPRTEESRRDTYRIVGGLRGDFNDDWHYEVSANYGQLNESTKIKGNLDVQRFLLAMDAVRDPGGNIVCNSTINPTAAFGYGPWWYATDPNAQAKLDADVAACVPINVFGGQFTDAQRAYLLQDTTVKSGTSQFDVTAFVSGDTSQFFNLWGGPIGFVLGAEYRADDIHYKQDPLVDLGYTFYNAIHTFEAPKNKVKEAFGEISIPIVKDKPFAHSLELDAAARVSDYTLGNTGTVWAYNFTGQYAPVRDLRFRANYARAVRAPNQSELFFPLSQNFAPGFTDPCSARNISDGTQFRADNCAAAGRPGGLSTAPGTYDFVYSQSLAFQSGGNPELEAEKSDSYTYGFVAEPRWIPGLSLSVDYYNIKVKNSINFIGAQTIVNQCYDLPTLDNPFCAVFQRAGPGGGTTEIPFQILENSLTAQPFNFAKLTARGIDTEIAYRGRVGPGRLDTRFTYTHVLDRSNFVDPTNPTFEDQQLLELGDPQDAFNWNSSYKYGRFTFGYQMRFIGKQVLNLYEDFFSVQGRDPQNPDYANRRFYPHRFYHDIRFAVDVGPKYNFYVGLDNATNTKPPLGLTGIGAGSGIYDNIGRFMYAGFLAKF